MELLRKPSFPPDWTSGSERSRPSVRYVDTTASFCRSVVRAFARGAMGHRIDPSWGGPIELFLVPASAPRLP